MRSKILLMALVATIAASGAAMAAPKAKKAAAGSSAVLPGGDSDKPINITAAKLDYFDKEQKLIYTGDVIAVQGGSTLKSSELTILLMPKKADGAPQPGQNNSSNSRVKYMHAKGPVTMVQPDAVSTGDEATYDKITNTIIMTGHVVYTQGTNVSKGDKLVFDRTTGQAVVTGARVSSMFIPDDATPAATPKPASAPASAPKRRKSAKRTE